MEQGIAAWRITWGLTAWSADGHFLGARQGAAAPMFPFEDSGGEAGWDSYGGLVRPGDFGATGLAAGAFLW